MNEYAYIYFHTTSSPSTVCMNINSPLANHPFHLYRILYVTQSLPLDMNLNQFLLPPTLTTYLPTIHLSVSIPSSS